VMHALLTGFVSISSALILGGFLSFSKQTSSIVSLANVFSLFAFSKLTNSVVLSLGDLLSLLVICTPFVFWAVTLP
jgi:hypothetical protein